MIATEVKDREVQPYIEAFISLLELKNTTKVYYTPLFNFISPHFKHARWVDKFKIIEVMEKWLVSCDDEDNGFVITNLFKTILQDEIRIKSKIVEDFVDKLSPNPMDWNLN